MNKMADSSQAEAPPFEEEFFGLLIRINRLLLQLADQESPVHALTPAQLWFLNRLDEAGCPQPISYFADGVLSKRSNATQMIDRLQGEGLVSRLRNPRDRRSVLVEMTALGAERLQEAKACHQHLVEALFQPFKEEESQSAIRVLRRVLALLEDFQQASQQHQPIGE